MATVCKTVVRKDYTGSNPGRAHVAEERIVVLRRLEQRHAVAVDKRSPLADSMAPWSCSRRWHSGMTWDRSKPSPTAQRRSRRCQCSRRDTRRISRPSATYRDLGSWTGRSTNVKPGPEAYDEIVFELEVATAAHDLRNRLGIAGCEIQ